MGIAQPRVTSIRVRKPSNNGEKCKYQGKAVARNSYLHAVMRLQFSYGTSVGEKLSQPKRLRASVRVIAFKNGILYAEPFYGIALRSLDFVTKPIATPE